MKKKKNYYVPEWMTEWQSKRVTEWVRDQQVQREGSFKKIIYSMDVTWINSFKNDNLQKKIFFVHGSSSMKRVGWYIIFFSLCILLSDRVQYKDRTLSSSKEASG